MQLLNIGLIHERINLGFVLFILKVNIHLILLLIIEEFIVCVSVHVHFHGFFFLLGN